MSNRGLLLAVALLVSSSACSDSDPLPTGHYEASGVLTNVPISSLTGWTQCYLDTYATVGTTLAADITAACTKPFILLGCRPVGAPELTVAAMGPRADVFFVTGNAYALPDATHAANGVAWYFDTAFSMGFAQEGDPVNLNSCDVATTPNSNLRLCWHTEGYGGFRCGAQTWLNSSTAWERLVFQAD